MLTFATLALLSACAPPPIDTSPAVKITWPPAESSEIGCTVVTVEIENFDVVDQAETDGLVDGQGHYHVVTPQNFAQCSAPFCIVDYSAAITADQAGELVVSLVDNKHQPILDANDQPVEASILFNYAAGACGLTASADTYL